MKTILVPSDFSKNSFAALRYALKLSTEFGGKLILFHCAHLPPNMLVEATTATAVASVSAGDNMEKKRELNKQLEKALKLAGLDEAPKGTKVIVESNPFVVENILEVAVKHRVSLIVTGTHGATGLQKFFFGSNTSELISKSEIPVLAIPELYRFKEIKSIAFSTDLHDFKSELKKVLPFAQAMQATLQVLYLDYGPGPTGNRLVEAQKHIMKSGYEDIKIVQRSATIEVPLIRQINEEVQKLRPTWVVMFTKERSFWDKLFHKSKTEQMVYDLKYPLLSFRKKGD